MRRHTRIQVMDHSVQEYEHLPTLVICVQTSAKTVELVEMANSLCKILAIRLLHIVIPVSCLPDGSNCYALPLGAG